MPGLGIRLANLKGGNIHAQPDRAPRLRRLETGITRSAGASRRGVSAAILSFDPAPGSPAPERNAALERLSFAGPRGPAAAVLLSLLLLLKTYVAKPSTRQRDWVLVDANGKTLGRLATQVANILRGKRKPEYTPHVDTGDFVVIVNAEKVHVTGDKRSSKMYRHHSGYPGGLRTRSLEEMLQRRPEEVIRIAVKGMLPRNRLARQQLRKLKVYAGPEHPHEAQKPTPVEMEKV
jgi:large subunit ribosomal protein L13